MATRNGYDDDIIAWAHEQARLLRAGQFAQLDIEHIADEIEDVAKAERREFVGRMAALLSGLMQWRFLPGGEPRLGRRRIDGLRQGVLRQMKKTPSLEAGLADPAWWEDIWGEATLAALKETGLEGDPLINAMQAAGLDGFPRRCPWAAEDILDPGWFPGE